MVTSPGRSSAHEVHRSPRAAVVAEPLTVVPGVARLAWDMLDGDPHAARMIIRGQVRASPLRYCTRAP